MANFDWDNIRCFMLVAQHGTLSEAARELELSVPTAARKIERLEAELGLKLFHRSQKGLKLTQHGEALLRFAEPGARHLNQVSRFARALLGEPNVPSVRVSATEGVVADILAPHLPNLCRDNPEISIDLEVSNQIADLNSGRTDIAIRMARPTEDTLIAKRLPPIALGLFCSPRYLAGRNIGDIDLKSERLLWLDQNYGNIPENAWLNEHGLASRASIRSSSVRTLFNAAVAGVGIAPLPVFTTQATNLIELPLFKLPERQPWLVFHKDTKDVARLKIARNWIVSAFKTALL